METLDFRAFEIWPYILSTLLSSRLTQRLVSLEEKRLKQSPRGTDSAGGSEEIN